MYRDIENLGTADNYLDEIQEMAHDIQLFDTFSISEVEMLCRHMQCYGAPRNYPLIAEGQDVDYLLLILTGWAEINQDISGHEAARPAEIMAGATVGELSLIDGQADSANCITTVPTDFAVLTQEGLNRLLVQSPRLANKLLLALLRRIVKRLRDVEQTHLSTSLH